MKLIILDRDGVINQDSDAFVKNPDEWIALPGSLHAIARLTQAGWKVVVATNQSGLARGLFDMDTLTAIHAKMRRELAAAGGSIDAVFMCPHGPDDNCTCRKPRPGMFEQIGHRYDVDLAGVPAVGDSLRDLQASSSVGCSPWLVLTGNGRKTLAKGGLPENARVFDDLSAVADALLQDS
ncbi:D-glycero-beta-D-manno-heptose 1,7-bisphosphate 7-phosphatase [Achromobacter veterisilvae]|uniref:D,D-heptose 1,7-bisphosphate phosphatase n=1 Tax=Achromobacter veterisilvae TaxID=2069367 RepID=A0ABZ2S416_9BURK|nr:D-glycero-beta-D-manno-heptose 1,7-bisphosphate 7-phosphatase [Achromobacter sp.]MCW0208786.1 D-glycero-beta-D-manno-heptose 1,7-bisphosphate 7-phosphatase [Achromobacter sp.]